MANILIGTPTTGSVKVEFTQSLFETHGALIGAGHSAKFLPSKGADIVRQRNAIASRFVEAGQFTHLLWLDSDMDIEPGLPLRMIAMNKPVVGVPYPKKHIDLERLVSLARTTKLNADVLIARSQDYVVRFEADRADVEGGAAHADGVGFGAVLIERAVFATMIERGAAKIKRNDASTRAEKLASGLYNFFDPIYAACGGEDYLTEDFSFCHRWKSCGGEIWAILDADVGHVGDMRFGGCFLSSRPGTA